MWGKIFFFTCEENFPQTSIKEPFGKNRLTHIQFPYLKPGPFGDLMFQYFLGYTHPVFDYPLIDSIYQSTTNASDASFAVDGKPDTCAFTNEDNLG